MILKDKVAIITGAASGIGKGAALEYLKEGAKVVFVDIDEKGLKKIEKGLKVGKDRYLLCPTDLLKKEDINAVVEATLKKFDTIDILVNNAADTVMKPLADITDEDFEFAVNMILRSTFWCTRAVIPVMMKNNYGKIINTASIAGKIGMPNLSLMVMPKHGIIGFTKAWAVEFGGHGINVNAVCPALLDTPSTRKRLVPNFQFVEKFVLQNTPLGRLTTPDEIARIYVFLASDDAAFMTGQAINFTGGFEMR